MRVLLQPAIAHFGKAEHPLDDPDRMFDPGPHFRFGAVFRPLDLIDNTAVAVAAIGEIAGFGRMLPDHRALAAIGLGRFLEPDAARYRRKKRVAVSQIAKAWPVADAPAFM